MRILAIDLSLTATGIAFPDKTTAQLAPSKFTGTQRLVDLRDRLMEIVRKARPDVIALEGYSWGSPFNAVPLGEWGGVFRVAVWELGVDVLEVQPLSLKKFITGSAGTGKKKKGEEVDKSASAKKVTMISALSARTGRIFENDNHADAWGLAALAHAYIGQPWVTLPKSHDEALTNIRWPECMVAARAAAGLPPIATPAPKASKKKAKVS